MKEGEDVEIVVPRFKQLSVENVWKLVVEIYELRCYFPDLKVHQLPNREFIFSMLATFKGDLLKRMIYNARKFRVIDSSENENENDFVYIRNEIYDEIS